MELGDEIGPLEVDITDDSVTAFCRLWGAPKSNRFTDESVAKEVGLAGPIVPGIMSMALMARLLTDWSSNGFLKRLDVVFRQPVPHGRVVIRAVITGKRQEDGEALIECDVHMSNEESGQLVGGMAVISLSGAGP